jgi:hypothetical protein
MPESKLVEDDRQFIPELRQQFLDRYNKEPEKYDEIDVKNVETNDWSVLRFIKYNHQDISKALDHLDTALQWRKEFGLNERSESDLPKEFVKAGAIFPYGCDDKGRTIIYMRAKVHKKVPKLMEYFRQFVVGVIEKVDKESGETGYALLFDLTGIGFSNADMEFLQFFISTLQNYYPYGMRYVIVYNLPRLLRPLWTIAKFWLGSDQKIIKFANGDEIKTLIPLDQLPKYLGGEADIDFTKAPDGCKSVIELGPKYGFTDDEVEKYMKMFEPHMKEAHQLVHGVK